MEQFLKRLALLLLAPLLALTVVGKNSGVDGKVVFCYWGTWANYRPGAGKFDSTNINPQLCTHIGYAFFGLADDGSIRSLDSWLDVDLGNIAKLVAMKSVNPNLKVMASVGGWNEGSAKYSAMAADATKRAKFVSSALQFLNQYGFDGLDLDWEYPVQRGGIAADKQNYVTLLQQLKQAFQASNYLLTVAVAAGQNSASISYNIPAVANQVDLINVMTYDFGGSWDPVLEHNAPLQGTGANNAKAAIEYWLGQGAPASKLVLGIPFYGRTFTLANNAQTSPGSANSGAGAAGPFTQEAGYLGYNEICADSSGWTQNWDAAASVPYAFKGNQWVTYDNAQSIGEKVAYLNAKNLAGAMVWSIETDDFRGNCGQAYPLLRTINNLIGTSTPTTSGPSTSSPTSSSSTSTSTAAPTSGPNNSCTTNGYFRFPTDCSSYYVCDNGVRYDFICPSGLYFDTTSLVCNWPSQVNCNV